MIKTLFFCAISTVWPQELVSLLQYLLVYMVYVCITTCRVNHSNNAIVKPHVKPEAAQREIDEAMKKVKEAQSLISAAIDTGVY